MWTLSGFIDEISPDFTEQCAVAADLGLKYAEVRSAWNINILDLKPEQLTTVKETLADHGLAVSSIGSPIGKISIDEEFGPHLERMKHAADVAHQLSAPRTSASSRSSSARARIPPTTAARSIERMRALARVAEDADLVLLHENEKDIYGDVPSRCLDVVRSVDSPHLRLAWDPANFVQVGVRPYTEGYQMLRPHLEYIQIKDALAADGTVVTAGKGDGEVAADHPRPARTTGSTGSSRSNRTWATTSSSGAFSGPELWRQAHADFTELLRAEGIEYA